MKQKLNFMIFSPLPLKSLLPEPLTDLWSRKQRCDNNDLRGGGEESIKKLYFMAVSFIFVPDCLKCKNTNFQNYIQTPK